MLSSSESCCEKRGRKLAFSGSACDVMCGGVRGNFCTVTTETKPCCDWSTHCVLGGVYVNTHENPWQESSVSRTIQRTSRCRHQTILVRLSFSCIKSHIISNVIWRFDLSEFIHLMYLQSSYVTDISHKQLKMISQYLVQRF